jgi:hypothetical protein
LKAVGTTIGANTGAPDLVGDEGVLVGEEAELRSFSSEDSVVVSRVVTFFSEGKKVLMTGLERRPTRPSCTALDVVLAGVWGFGGWVVGCVCDTSGVSNGMNQKIE